MLARYGRPEGLAATAQLEASQAAWQDLVLLRTRRVSDRPGFDKLAAQLDPGEARRQVRRHLPALDHRVVALNEP